jgi:hypothetical protein
VSDPDPIELAMRVVQQTSAAPEGASFPDAATAEKPNLPPPLPIAPTSSGLTPAARTKGKKTAHELAAMILDDLRQIEGCPKRGVRVTVYGCNPWNSWLSFGGEAGPVPNKVDLQGFCDIITERLKRLYDVLP